MADDLSLIVGEIRGATKALVERVDRSDEQTDAKINHLAGQIKELASQHETDKEGAIARAQRDKTETATRSETQHAENQGELKALNEKATLTGGRVSVLEKVMDEDVRPVVSWYRDEGSKIGGRVSLLEQAKVQEATERAQAETAKAGRAGEQRGFIKTWGLVVSLILAIGGMLAWLGADRLSAALLSFAVMLGGGHG